MATTPRQGFGYSVGRAPSELDLEDAAADAVDRATRLLGAKKARSSKLTAVLDRRVTATLLGILSGTLSGEEVVKGRSLFAGRIGEQVGVGELTLIDDPTNPLAYGASQLRRRGAGLPVQLADRGRRAEGVPVRHLRRTPRRHRLNRLGGSRWVPDNSRCGCSGPGTRSRANLTRQRSLLRSAKVFSCSRSAVSIQGSIR